MLGKRTSGMYLYYTTSVISLRIYDSMESVKKNTFASLKRILQISTESLGMFLKTSIFSISEKFITWIIM